MKVSRAKRGRTEKVCKLGMLSDLGFTDVCEDTGMGQPVNAAQRVAARIKERLAEIGMTGRAFAKELGHGDAWISNLLTGRFALSLSELDHAAHILKLPPGELVRLADDAWDLAPRERRLVRAIRTLPPVVSDHLTLLAEYLIGVTPEEVPLLQKVRCLTTPEIRKVEHWIDVTLLARGHEQETRAPLDLPESTGPRPARAPRTPKRRAVRA